MAAEVDTQIKLESSALSMDSPAVLTPGLNPNDGSPNGSAMAGQFDETPSPSVSNASHPQGSSASKRPPRKSTLTQQQKNAKRQRATQEQLNILEMEFNKNPTPTAQVRDRIAEEIDMTERSVQIWFQNRRAKIKLMAKKSLETGEDFDSIPESMRNYLAMQAMESGKGLGGQFLGRGGLMPGYGPGSMLVNGDQGAGKVLIHHLSSRSLNIGSWTRVAQSTMDLIIFYSPDKCTMTYYINNEQAGYKIEYPFAYIKNIYLENQEGDPNKPSGIVIELNRPPHFFMDQTSSATGFFQCGDFTEDQQASHCLVHHLGGNPKVLSGQLAKLVSLEVFTHRHNQTPFFENHAISVSAPVSPTARPSSQPNFAAAPPHVGMFQESWGVSQPPQAGMRGPGHKRQRSRSVPMAVDLSMLQTPMPSFYIQQPGESAPPPSNPNIFAPVPQQPSAVGPNLRIDTQAGFGLDMRQYPMSATTASPSEFPHSPSYFSQGGPEPSPMHGSNYNTPYNGAFLSPMPNTSNMGPPSMSPLPFNSPREPSIVEQSPPLSMLGRPASADIYQQHGDNSCAVSDDGGSLNEMYSKHSINLPMHPHSPAHADQTQAELDMNQLVQFDHVDPASLSPESMNQAPHQQQ